MSTNSLSCICEREQLFPLVICHIHVLLNITQIFKAKKSYVYKRVLLQIGFHIHREYKYTLQEVSSSNHWLKKKEILRFILVQINIKCTFLECKFCLKAHKSVKHKVVIREYGLEKVIEAVTVTADYYKKHIIKK